MDSSQDAVRLRLNGLGGRYEIIISPEDVEEVKKHHWIAHGIKDERYVYAVRYETYRTKDGKSCRRRFYLHRQLLNAPRNLLVDHRNRNTLDNRRSNLRLATHAQNIVNSAVAKPSKSGFRGVYELKSGKFVSYYSYRGKQIRVGNFVDAEEAARAYDAAVVKTYGEFAVLNFPTLEAAE